MQRSGATITRLLIVWVVRQRLCVKVVELFLSTLTLSSQRQVVFHKRVGHPSIVPILNHCFGHLFILCPSLHIHCILVEPVLVVHWPDL
jgi:hypothetical protein